MKKIVSMFLALVMLLSMTCNAFAAETNSTTVYPDMTKEEAMETLGLSEEEMEGMEIHRLSSEEDGISVLNLPEPISNGVYYEDITVPANFTGVIHTLDGTKMKWAARLMDDLQGASPVNVFSMHIVLLYTTGHVISYCDIDQENPLYDPDYWWDIGYSKQVYFKYSYIAGGGWADNVKQTLRIVVAVL